MDLNTSELDSNDLNFIEKKTNLNADNILELYKHFCTKYPNGLLSRDEFHSIAKRLTNAEKDDQEVLDRLFEMCDHDSNGFIDFKEYLVLFWCRAKGKDLDKLEFIFDIFDKDNNGYLDFYELHLIVKILFKLKQNSDFIKSVSSYSSFNNGHNNDKSVNMNGGSLLTPTYYLTFDIMKKFDGNRNGKLTKDEFIQGCLNHEKIKDFLNPFNVSKN